MRILKSKAKSASPVHLILSLKPSIVTTIVTSFGGRHAGSALHLISHHSKGADAALRHSLQQECDGRVLGIIGAVDASVPILQKFLFGQARSIGRIGRVSPGAGTLREMANGNPIAHHRPPALWPAPVFWHRNDLRGFAGIIAGDWII